MSEHLLVRTGGLLSTIQDQGRYGFQQYGVSAAGALDQVSLAIANALVGNPAETEAVEMTLVGPSLSMEAEFCRVALAGAAFKLTINGTPAQCFTAHDLRRGDIIEIGAAGTGMRAYLAIAGGLDLVPSLGSLSTHSRSQLGGVRGDGRPLQAGDLLPLKNNKPRQLGPLLTLAEHRRPSFDGPVRVILGPYVFGPSWS